MTPPIGALASQMVFAALSGKIEVAAAAVVVVLAILLVFVMVIRSNGAAKRTASGIGSDAASQPPSQAQPSRAGYPGNRASAYDAYGADDRNEGYGGYNANVGAPGYDNGYDEGAYGRAPQRADARSGQRSGYGDQDAWGANASPAQGRWNEQAAQPVAQGQQRGAPQWGAQGSQGLGQAPAGAPPWGAPDDNWGAADGWGRQQAPVSRPSGNNPFSSPSGVPNGGQMRAGAQGPQGDWGMPQGPQSGQGRPSQWGAQQGSPWDADPAQQDWPAQQQDWNAPAPVSPPPGRGRRDWDAAAGQMDQWGASPAPGQQDWGAPPAGPMSQPGRGAPMGPAGARAGAANAPAGMNGGIGFGEPEKTRVVRPPNPQAHVAALITRQGKEPGHVDELRNERTTIGRSRESDIFLEDLAVSRTHAIITREPSGRYVLRDNNSANGVFVNGERITEVVLEEGDEIQIGQTMLAFQRR